MMSELQGIQQAVKPSDTLLVVDAMTGQEAAGLVKAFNEAAPLTGLQLLARSSLHLSLCFRGSVEPVCPRHRLCLTCLGCEHLGCTD